MKCILTVLLLITTTSIPAKSSNHASWAQRTPGGSAISHTRVKEGYTNGIICKDIFKDYLSQGQESHAVTNLKKWYFYKNHIIGQYKHTSQVQFFIFNESTCVSKIFTNEIEFKNQIKLNQLKPLIWTRWHKENYGIIFTEGHIGHQLTFIWLYMPILIGLTIFFIITLSRTRFNLNKKINKINLTITGIILIRILLDFYPQSF
jgi:hypothetical protein